MALTSTLQEYHRRITASGSPFRVLRKAALYATHPRESVSRLVLKNDLLRNLPASIKQPTAEMERTGFARTDGIIDQSLLHELTAEIDRRMEGYRPGVDKVTERKFWSRLTSEEDLDPSTIFIRFAMQQNVVKMATAYMGMVPYLSNVQVLVSFGTEAGKWAESQLWHRDYHDTKTLRLWVYLTDVTEVKHGPFTYLPLEQSRKVPNTFFPDRVSDEQMESLGFAKDAQAVNGPRHSCFAIDTARCYHMGSRLELGQIRVAYLATFNTHASLWPFYNNITVAEESKLSPLDRMLLCPGLK